MPYKDREKKNEQSRKYYKENREKILERDRLTQRWRKHQSKKYGRSREYYKRVRDTVIRKRYLGRKYGITLEEYEQFLANQNGCCAICKKINLNGRKLAVDHDHLTGIVRSLLCDRCNRVLGEIQEDMGLLDEIRNYLKSHKEDR